MGVEVSCAGSGEDISLVISHPKSLLPLPTFYCTEVSVYPNALQNTFVQVSNAILFSFTSLNMLQF